MASPSPTPPSLSPTPHPAHLHHGHPSSNLNAAATAPQSKRDKRRHALSEKLSTLTTSFHNPANPRARDTHYRAQLASLQADIQLVTKCDASGQDMRLLDDSSDTIHREVEDALTGMGLGDLVVGGQGGARGNSKDDPSVMGGAGRWYGDFLEKVNQSMEERDAQLTLLYNQYRHKSASLAAHHTRSIVHAKEEHKSLASTIQARLMARLKTQLKKLAAEKESNSSTTLSSLNSLSTSGYTDLSETNALLLHPSQFGIVPSMGSPTRRIGDDDMEKETGRRKPRRRAGEVEELLSFGVGINFDPPSSNGKRKRTNRSAIIPIIPTTTTTTVTTILTAPSSRDRGDNPDKESDDHAHAHAPAPAVTNTPPSGSVLEFTTPLESTNPPSASIAASTTTTATQPTSYSTSTTDHQRRRREELLKQVYAPIYSFDKLFTEKELLLAGNQASLATVRYFTERQHLHYGDEDSDGEEGGPVGTRTPVVANNGTHNEDAAEEGNDTDAAAAEMLSRVYSVNTRSNPPRAHAAGTREIESLVLGGVPGIGMTYVNKAGIAPPPPGLRSEDAESDLVAMRRGVVLGSDSQSGVARQGGSGPINGIGLGLAGIGGTGGGLGGNFGGFGFSGFSEDMRRGESGRGDGKRTASNAGLGMGGDGKKVRRG